MISTGIYCFILHKVWFSKVYFVFKLPIFLQVAISVTLCIVFSIVDLLNFLGAYFSRYT